MKFKKIKLLPSAYGISREKLKIILTLEEFPLGGEREFLLRRPYGPEKKGFSIS